MVAATTSRAVLLRYLQWLVFFVSILAFSINNGAGNNSDMMLLAEGFTADDVVVSRRNSYLHSQSIPLQISTSSVGLRRKNQHRIDLSLFSSIGKINNNDDAGDDGKKKKKKKKKTQLVISTNLDRDNTSTSSDEILSGKISATGRIDIITRPQSTKLGVPSKRKMKDLNNNSNKNDRDKNKNQKRLSMKAQKIKNQRTSGGLMNSNKSATNNKASGGGDDNRIRIVLGKRGSKTVTMIQGMKISLEERKKLLKEVKNKVGGGGTVVDGVLEIQGSHNNIVYEFLLSKGYNNIKK
ncbi:hypothetical protein FRACYDRAFT_250230 [Fragilariopsis cylindrus CCMP1102]|uniref:SUI1 domain-containing protein n=1 Tax=Fragilariopsis cylindrus CCMP1102 TaxID=635003 RepID=A0A1E7EPV1_9STRA|nr:hypothetical protein FRACYDRAFT_250230 [Fragilariopsis cylindrus CCMP1102]|eukprot:OEU08010.1 hypothetical protein FRACYDRAFT_250230 [Fragilariopsis cylindrus CCMP1102]